MGGDNAPKAIVEGALFALKDFHCEIILIGDENRIKTCIGSQSVPSSLSILHTNEAVAMNENPTAALRQKKKTSVFLATEQVKKGLADAIISAGNTGALLEVAVLTLGRLKGIRRPAIVTPMPTPKGLALLLDAGANSDNKPEHLLQFGIMGSIYAEKVLGRKKPKVGLLNIGKEPNKGNAILLEARELLEHAPVNFIGNVEPFGFLDGEVDVVVCDGFVGNMVLKTAEAVSEKIFSILKKEFSMSFTRKIGALLLLPAFKSIKSRLDQAEYGGAPFLGVNGICLKSHGRANPRAIRNAIKVALETHKNGMIGALIDTLATLGPVQKNSIQERSNSKVASSHHS